MNLKPIDNSIKTHFNAIYKLAENRAGNEFGELRLKLEVSSHFEQMMLLTKEDQRIDQLTENSDYPYYIKYDGESLLSQFASRLYLLGVDETQELEYAIYLNKYHTLINDEIGAIKTDIPKYTFDMFIDGVDCKYFRAFNKEYTTDEHNYNLIRNWRVKILQELVSKEHQNLIIGIQSRLKDHLKPLEYITAQKKLIVDLLETIEISAPIIRAKLMELTFLNITDAECFTDEALIENLEMFRKSQLNLDGITPKSMHSVVELVKKKHKGVVGSEISLFYSIVKVEDWMDEVLDGLPVSQVVNQPKWNTEISAAKYKAKKEVKAVINAIETKAYDDSLPDSEIRAYLIEYFEIYREKFNNFQKKDFFYAFRKEDDQLLKRMIITNAFFGNNLSGELQDYHNAILIHEISWAIVEIFSEIFETHRIRYDDDDTSHFAVMSLLNSMVLDKELYNAINQSLDDFMSAHQHYHIPIDILFQNQKDNMHHIFHRGIKRLQTVLNDAEPTNKILYLQSRLKDLKQRELQMKQFGEDREVGTYDDRYSLFLKDFLSLETDFIDQTKGVVPLLPLKLGSRGHLQISANGLGDMISTDKQDFILEMLEEFSLTKNGLSIISTRKKGALRGVVEALVQANILPAKSLEVLCNAIAEKIRLDLKSKLDYSNISEEYRKKAVNYIKDNYK